MASAYPRQAWRQISGRRFGCIRLYSGCESSSVVIAARRRPPIEQIVGGGDTGGCFDIDPGPSILGVDTSRECNVQRGSCSTFTPGSALALSLRCAPGVPQLTAAMRSSRAATLESRARATVEHRQDLPCRLMKGQQTSTNRVLGLHLIQPECRRKQLSWHESWHRVSARKIDVRTTAVWNASIHANERRRLLTVVCRHRRDDDADEAPAS